jgi:hypothetical protein
MPCAGFRAYFVNKYFKLMKKMLNGENKSDFNQKKECSIAVLLLAKKSHERKK